MIEQIGFWIMLFAAFVGIVDAFIRIANNKKNHRN